MMKKKMISMVLILTMATGLMTGCGSNETGETGQKETGTADTTENKTVTMASNPFVGLAPFYVAMDKGFFEHPPRQSAAGGTGEKSGGQCGRTTLLELVRL